MYGYAPHTVSGPHQHHHAQHTTTMGANSGIHTTAAAMYEGVTGGSSGGPGSSGGNSGGQEEDMRGIAGGSSANIQVSPASDEAAVMAAQSAQAAVAAAAAAGDPSAFYGYHPYYAHMAFEGGFPTNPAAAAYGAAAAAGMPYMAAGSYPMQAPYAAYGMGMHGVNPMAAAAVAAAQANIYGSNRPMTMRGQPPLRGRGPGGAGAGGYQRGNNVGFLGPLPAYTFSGILMPSDPTSVLPFIQAGPQPRHESPGLRQRRRPSSGTGAPGTPSSPSSRKATPGPSGGTPGAVPTVTVASPSPMSGTEADFSPASIARASARPAQDKLQQALRTDHVMWVGNVPSDATVPELWQFFSTLSLKDGTVKQQESTSPSNARPTMETIADGSEGTVAADPLATHGILSIFIISRSNCAFVNYIDAEILQRAVSFFAGKSLRPHDPHCPRLVCRVRKKDEEVQAGVAGQRGKGYHIAFVKEHERKRKEDRTGGKPSSPSPAPQLPDIDKLSVANTDPATPMGAPMPPEDAADVGTPKLGPVGRGATTDIPAPQDEGSQLVHDPSSGSLSTSSGSISYTSTNSSLLRHPAFKERFFILKSHAPEDLHKSTETGTWATQPHNEEVLDQAFRNSQNVYLIFSANQSGEWFGVARMVGPIKQPTTPKSETSPLITRRLVHRPETIVEESSDSSSSRQHTLQPPAATTPGSEQGNIPVASPSQISIDDDTKRLDFVHSPAAMTARASRSRSPTPPGSHRDSVGVLRKDMLVETAVGEEGSFSGSLVEPSDSVSVTTHSRDLQQLAVRALIHNLRLDERESSQKAAELEQSLSTGSDTPVAKTPEPIGKPFKVEWIVVKSVPFHATRKLRNPWRDNRQVKVSRDGTELEPTIGREMLDLFTNYDPNSAAADDAAATNTSPSQPAGDQEQEDDA